MTEWDGWEEWVGISWSPDLRVAALQGACETVLHRSPEAIRGASLDFVLGLSADQARGLDAIARAMGLEPKVQFASVVFPTGPTTLRLKIGMHQGEAHARVVDLNRLLKGAPPVQISNLASSLSHEIRNPLSSVKMAVQTLARNSQLSERDQRRLAIAQREIRTVERMLWLLSEYGRDGPPTLQTLPLKALLEEAASMIAPELAERRISLRVVESQTLPPVRVDPSRLRPVLAQLLLNVAVGYPDGEAVELQAAVSDKGGVTLSMADPSASPPPEQRASVFEPFGSMLARGAGLSLAALYQAMRAHDGSVMAESGAGPGTRYTLTFP